MNQAPRGLLRGVGALERGYNDASFGGDNDAVPRPGPFHSRWFEASPLPRFRSRPGRSLHRPARPRRLGELRNRSPHQPSGWHFSLSAATEARARMIEQRQALIEAALSGQKIDPQLIAAAAGGRVAKDGPLARVEEQQLQQAALVAQALDVRYQVTAAELKRLGISPAPAGQTAASAARSRASAMPASRPCSTAGRSSTSCRTASSRSRPTSRSRPR